MGRAVSYTAVPYCTMCTIAVTNARRYEHKADLAAKQASKQTSVLRYKWDEETGKRIDTK